MKTDKQLYQIFSANPVWLFELTGMTSPGSCRMQSVSLKALDQSTDGLIVPEDDTQPLTIVEFQFQSDETIYTRTAIEMALVQQEFRMREVQGVILFHVASHDPQTHPWSRIIESYNFGDLLGELEKAEPTHPLVAVFKPVLETNDDTLRQNAVNWFRSIRDSPLDSTISSRLLDVFVNWLEQRFRNTTKQEIEAMLLGDLPDLRDTRSGQDLIAIGRKEALQETAVRLITARFGDPSDDVLTRIQQLDSIETLEALPLRILEADSVEKIF